MAQTDAEIPRTQLEGATPFAGLNVRVSDFWRFALGDSRTNNLRGYMAEFLVDLAVGGSGKRVEWDAFDVKAADGTLIEVKSTGYVQAWEANPGSVAKPPRAAVFTGLRSKALTSSTYAETKSYNAEVYVFCEETERDPSLYDPLDLAQWRFFVLSRRALSELNQDSVSLPRVEVLTGGSTPHRELAAAVGRARLENGML